MTIETIKSKIYVHVSATDPDLRHLSVRDYNASEYGYILLGTLDIEMDVDREETIAKAVIALRAEAQKKRAEGEAEARKLEEIAQKLLALPAPGTMDAEAREIWDAMDSEQRFTVPRS